MSPESQRLEHNKKTVVAFYQKTLFEGDVIQAILKTSLNNNAITNSLGA